MEHLPKLCEAICRGDHYSCKDDLFRLQSAGTYRVARMYLDKQFICFKLTEMGYLINMFQIVQIQQTKYILALPDVMAYETDAVILTVYVMPAPNDSTFSTTGYSMNAILYCFESNVVPLLY